MVSGASCGRRGKGRRWIAWISVALTAYFAARNVATWPVRLRYPGELAFIEGVGMTEMVALARGHAIYAKSIPGRVYTANYGPLYYWAGSRLEKGRDPSYFPLRVLSLWAVLASAAGCAFLAYMLTRRYGAAVLGFLIALSFRISTSYGVSARADAVGLAAAFWGFLIAYRLRHRRWQVACVPLFLLSLFWKPQFFAAPLAILADHLVAKRYRAAMEFLAALGGAGLALLAALELLIFHGQTVLHHILLNNLVPLSLAEFRTGLISYLALCGLPAWAGIEVLRSRDDKALSAYLILAFVICWLGLSKAGSASNYLLETTLIISPLFAAWLWVRVEEAAAGAEMLILVALALLLSQQAGLPTPVAGDFARDLRIQAYLRSNFPAGTLALGYYAGDLTRAGLDVPVPDLWQAFTRSDSGDRNADYLADRIEKRDFAVLITRTDLHVDLAGSYITKPMLGAMLRSYRVACVLDLPRPEMHGFTDRFYAWVPRAPGEVQGQEMFPPGEGECGL